MDILSGKRSKPDKKSSKNFELEEGPGSSDNSHLIKTKKLGVWSEDENKSAKTKAGHNIIELERFQKDQNEDGIDDIPVIPDIDDLQEDLHNLADAKKIISVDESTYKELDSQLHNLNSAQVTFGNLGDIDMSFLINKMYPESEVKQCQEVWTLDSLYKDISKHISDTNT